MVAFEGNGQCREAQIHYHDFLCDRSAVPKYVADHIDGCAHCRAQVRRLGQMLGEVTDMGNPCRLDHSRELIAELQSHFEHVGEQVTCSQVRPFLPGLLADRIRIPTPVTVHIDQCGQCAEDLEQLRLLGLTEEQLARLEKLYSGPVRTDSSLCRQFKLMLAEADDLRLEEMPAHIADHICLCPQCRTRLYRARQDLLDHCREHPVADPYISCSRIMTGDVFDLVVPHGEDSTDRAPVDDWQRTIADHVFSCPRCLAKVQNMHRIIYGVAERADSGVATVYATTGTAMPPSRAARGSYGAYPIDVRVVGGRLETAHRRSRRTGELVATLRRRMHGRKLKSSIPTAAVAAGVVLLAGLFVISGRSASALNVGQLNRTLSKVPSIHIISFGRDGSEVPTLQTWVSSSVGVFAQEIPGQPTRVWDTHKRRTIMIAPGQSQVQETDMTARDYKGIMQSIQNTLESEFVGFSADTELQHQDGSADETDSTLDVYEITSQGPAQYDGSVERRMLVYLDPVTKLLKMTESYRKSTPHGPWELGTTRRFEYPSDAEVLRHFKGIISRN